MSTTAVQPGQIIAGRYRIDRLLGQGGMGSVYRAIQVSLDRPVALKRLVDEQLEHEASVERFEREAHALARLVHRSTVRLFDFGTDERRCPFIVMELLQGCDLAVDIERQGPLRWDHALQVCQQILGSLAEAHDAGIVHRDIKPANVFLCVGAEWPRVKVLDFGIAGGPEQEGGPRRLTLTGTVLGSAAYMSPEQAQGKPVGPAADLYALGVVLFEMLTGRVPFDAPLLTAQLLAKVLQPAPALEQACPGLAVPEGVRALVAALLEREAARRPPSARAAIERIEGLLAEARSLPPLGRVVQLAGAGSWLPPTEPMLLPQTCARGWAPPATGTGSEAARPGSRRRPGFALAAVLPLGAAGALAWGLALQPRAAEAPVAQLAPVSAAGFTTARAPELLGGAFELEGAPEVEMMDAVADVVALAASEVAAASDGASPSTPAPVEASPERQAARVARRRVREPSPARQRAVAAPARAAADGSPPVVTEAAAPVVSATVPTPRSTSGDEATPTVGRNTVPAAVTTTPSAAVAAPAAPAATGATAPMMATTDAPSPAPVDGVAAATPEGPLVRAPGRARYQTVAEADAAEASGHITPLQRNDIIAALRQRRLEARARVARDHRLGRISHAELRERQRVIDRELEGLERAAFAPPAASARARRRGLLRIGP